MKRTLIHVLTIFLLIFSLLTPGLAVPDQSVAATPTDVSGHWAYTYIARGIQLGFISGYPNGTFLPDKAVSRAEFAKMINAALGNTGTVYSDFNDVPSSEWFYNDVSKAVAAKYVDGYGDGKFLPNNPISRQEAAVMIARIIPSYGIYANLNTFKDGSKTADWATEYMKKVVGKAYLGAYDDGLLHPSDSLTRAQTAKIICSILDKESIEKSFTTIKATDTVAKNTIYTNTVTLSKDLGEGHAAFQNCTLLGGLTVNGGGKDTITIENSRITQLDVNKSGAIVRILAKGSTTIALTQTQEICTLETASLEGGIFGKGFVGVDVRRNADTTFKGNFPLVNMVGSGGTARLEGCSLEKLVITKDASSSNVHIDSSSTLATTDVNAVTAFHGKGTIKQMNANVSGITYETKPTNWTLASGVLAPKEANPDLKAVFVPDNGATSVAITVKPTLTFTSEIETFKGDAVSDAYLKDNLFFKKGSATGANVAFTAALSSNKKTITLSPTGNLESNQSYYLGFAKDTFRTVGSKESLTAKSVIFTTINTATTVSFNPANNAVQFATTGSLKITFSEGVFNNEGKAITGEYLATAITVLKDGVGGNLNTSASSITGNVVTIPGPLGGWGDGSSYTITVKASSFKSAAGTFVKEASSTFTAGTAGPIMTISSATGRTSSVLVDAKSNIAGKGYFVVIKGTIATITPPSIGQIKAGTDSAGAGVSWRSPDIGISDTTFSITGLSSGENYVLYGLINGNGKDSVADPKDFTTTLPDASLNSLGYSYTASGGALAEGSLTLTSTMNLNVPNGATAISITATGPSDVTITFSGGSPATGSATLASPATDMASLTVGQALTFTITTAGTAGTSYSPMSYNLTLTKTE